jgi:hypothetical protein
MAPGIPMREGDMRTTISLTDLAVAVTPRDATPERGPDDALRFGVGEVIDVRATGLPLCYASLTWSVEGAAETALVCSSGCDATFTAPDVPAGDPAPLSYQVTLSLKMKTSPTSAEATIATVVFDVIRPSNGRILNHADRHLTRTDPTHPKPNAGMWGVFMIGPADVSFQNVLIKEGAGENIADSPLGSGIANTMVSYAAGRPHGHVFSAHWMTPGSTEGGRAAYDRVHGTRMGVWDDIRSLSPADPVDGWDLTETDTTIVGTSVCTIDWHYALRPTPDTENGRKFCEVVHEASVTRGGTLTVSKGGSGNVTKTWSGPTANWS